MSDAKIAAIDVGSGYVKAITNGLGINRPRISFPSVVGECPESWCDQSEAGEIPIIKYEGKTWLTGQYALERLSPSQVVDTLHYNWAGSTPWTVLLLRALFDLGIRHGDVNLVTGIPQTEYRDRWSGIAANLMGEHRAMVNGTPLIVNIVRKKSMIIPQVAAGVYYLLSQSKELQEIVQACGLIGGIDVGTYTTGFAVLEGGRFLSRLSDEVDIGMSRVASVFGKQFYEKYGVFLDMKESMRMIENRHKVLLKDTFVDLSEDVASAVNDVFSGTLSNVIYSYWGDDANRMKICVYGGGSVDFFPFIQNVFPDAELIHMNAIGGAQYLPVLGMLTYYTKANFLEM